MKITISFLSFLFLLVLLGCSGGEKGGEDISTPSTYTITVLWDPNSETLVNTPSGGYKVYYSQNPSFSINDVGVNVKDVQYVSGSLSPTSTTLTLVEGTWYIKVVAYFSLNGEVTSLPSKEISINLL